MEADGNDATLLSRTRSAARELSRDAQTPQARAAICLDLLSPTGLGDRLADLRSRLHALPVDERHYWIGVLYTLLLPTRVRRAQATYFTPPLVAEAVVDLVLDAGFDLATGDVLDPAAGGAAFLSTIAGRMMATGLPGAEAIHRLNGIEIDAGLAALSRRLVADRLGVGPGREVIVAADALRTPITAAYELVITNPPYGRVSQADVEGTAWSRVSHCGHINKYALFAELCVRSAKPGGLVALVIPSSFRAGPLYDRMRSFVRERAEVLAIGSVAGRDGVFVDVAQDVSVLVLRKGRSHDAARLVGFPTIGAGPSPGAVAEQRLPDEPGRAWPLPAAEPGRVGGATLADYGVSVRAGYFVWNREGDRLVSELADRSGYPLVWARNVRPGSPCVPAGKRGAGMDFVLFGEESTAVVRGPAAVMQRTTNDKQARRLVAAMVDPAVERRWGGFVTENHTIVLTCEDAGRLALAVALLNTAAVDRRYRRLSGTAAVSVTLLRGLDLPTPDAFAAALAANGGDAEAAAEAAYARRAELVDA